MVLCGYLVKKDEKSHPYNAIKIAANNIEKPMLPLPETCETDDEYIEHGPALHDEYQPMVAPLPY